MKAIQIFDPALCCSSSVCGTEVDQALVTFAADFAWAKQNGAKVERFNLSKQPQVFAENEKVRAFLERSGAEALPLILVNGEVALAGRYPSKNELRRWANIKTTNVEKEENSNSECCSGNKCC